MVIEAGAPSESVQWNCVDNGIPFFMANKMNFMIHEDIVNIYKYFYDNNDTVEANALMYEQYKCLDQAKAHGGTNRALNDVKKNGKFYDRKYSSNVHFLHHKMHSLACHCDGLC